MRTVLEPVLLLAGAVLIALGAGMAYLPAGPIVGGTLLVGGVILRARGAQ